MNNRKRLAFVIGGVVAIIIIIIVFVFAQQTNHDPQQVLAPRPDISHIDASTWPENNQDFLEETLNTLKEDPYNVKAWRNLANLYRSVDDYQKALEALEYANSLDPNDTIVLMNLASIYYLLGKYDQAEQTYLKVIKINPVWIGAYTELFELYRYQMPEKLPELLVLIDKGRSLDFDDQYEKQFLRIKGGVYTEMGDTSSAIDAYRAYLKLEPNDQVIQQRLTELGGTLDLKEGFNQ